MFVVVIAAAMTMQGVSAEARDAYRSCLNNAVVSARAANVTVDGFKDYAFKTCGPVADGFKARLVTFNVKNGMSKKAAADDAQIQLEDYLYTYEEKFRYAAQPPK